MNGRSLSMWYNTFDNNGRGTSVSGSNSLTIAYNKILVSAPNAIYPRPVGALVVASKGYDIGDNVFDKCSTCGTRSNVTQGLVIKNQHIFNTLALRNTFNNLGFATIGLQKNGDPSTTATQQGLQFKCNDYLSGGIGDVTRLSIDQSNGSSLSATLRRNQGDPATSGKSAGNRFYNSCAGLNHLTSDNLTTQLVKYYYNSISSLYDPQTCITSVYNRVSNPPSQSSDCPARYSSGSPTFRLAETNELLAGSGLTEDDRQSLLTDQFNLVSDISRDYCNADAYDSAAVLLESYSRYAEALPHYLHLGDWSNARRVWNMLPLDSTDDHEYSSLMDIAINLFSTGQSWTDLDSSGIATVVTMSSSNTLPGYLAQAVAAQNGWIPSFIWPDAGIEGDSSYDTTGQGGGGGLERRAPAITSTVSINGIQLYPNPTTGAFTIQSGSAGTGVLYNLQGLRVVQYDVKEGRNDIALPSGLASGIYMLRFTDNTTGSTYNTRLVFHP